MAGSRRLALVLLPALVLSAGIAWWVPLESPSRADGGGGLPPVGPDDPPLVRLFFDSTVLPKSWPTNWLDRPLGSAGGNDFAEILEEERTPQGSDRF